MDLCDGKRRSRREYRGWGGSDEEVAGGGARARRGPGTPRTDDGVDRRRRARRERPAAPRHSSVAERAPESHAGPTGRGRTRRAAPAATVGPRRRRHPPAPHRRRTQARPRATAHQSHRHRLGRADDPLRRYRGATKALVAQTAERRGVLVPALQRTQRRQRPRLAHDERPARRRRVGHLRSEGVDQLRPPGHLGHPAGAHLERGCTRKRASVTSSVR